MTAGTACSRCGADIESGARFCLSCGNEAVRPSAPTLATPAPGNVTTSGAAEHYQQELVDELRQATLGEYEILTQLGQGGMATVYLAHDIHLDRKVAIKVMSPALLSGPGMVDRFKLEARTSAKLSHPHIIPIFAVKEVGKLLFFVMKFVEGRPLDSIIKELGRLPLPMVMTILTKVGEGLGYAHRNGVVHRDIKPANIMIDVEGLPVVTDFGIAKVADQQGLTQTGATIGTPTYMSPEQCASGKITGASDQYSLGILTYEMLTGEAPFVADSLMTIMYMHCHDEPPEVMELRADCPPRLKDVVLRMLAKDPADRWGSMEEMVGAVGGSTTLAFNDPVRTQLVGLAMAGESHKAMARISTPRSPMPMLDSGPDSVQGTNAPTMKMATGAPLSEAGPAKGGAKKVWLGIGGVLVAGAAVTLAVFQPWVSTDPVASGASQVATAPVTQLLVTPNPVTLQVGGAPVVLTAQALDSAGAAATADLEWTTSDPGVATVSDEGMVSAIAAGPATIRVAAGSITTNVAITVIGRPVVDDPRGRGTPAAVASVRLSGGRDRPQVGESFQFHATPVDNGGRALSGRSVTWESSDPRVATVDVAGLVTARAEGPVTITARSGSVFSPYPLQVQPESVTRVALRPSAVDPLTVGGSVMLTASAFGSRNNALTGRKEVWRSMNTAAATVQGGVVTAVAPGLAEIEVTIDGQRAAVVITVEADIPEPPTVDPEEAIRSVVQQYTQALQLKDFTGLRRVFPNLPPDQERQLRQNLEPMENLEVTAVVGDVRIVGDQANVDATLRYVGSLSGRGFDQSGSLTLVLRRNSDGRWVITETRG